MAEEDSEPYRIVHSASPPVDLDSIPATVLGVFRLHEPFTIHYRHAEVV